MQHKYVEEFQRQAMIEFQKLREELENEMDDRFASQDEIIDNLSNSIKTFQDTMKIIGQTVIWAYGCINSQYHTTMFQIV